MSTRAFVRSLSHSFLLGWRTSWSDREGLLGTLAAFLIMKGLWVSVWAMTSSEVLAQVGLNHSTIIWYFLTAELTSFPVGRMYREVEYDIQSGQALSFFLRPINYVPLKVAEMIGTGLLKMIILIPICAAFAYAVTGTFLPLDIHVGVFLFLIFLGYVLWILIHAMIGLSSLWVNSAKSVAMLLNKSLLIFGGFILPLKYYPPFLKYIAWATPFPVIMYAPASVGVGIESDFLILILAQILWMIILIALLYGLAKAFERRVLIYGSAR